MLGIKEERDSVIANTVTRAGIVKKLVSELVTRVPSSVLPAHQSLNSGGGKSYIGAPRVRKSDDSANAAGDCVVSPSRPVALRFLSCAKRHSEHGAYRLGQIHFTVGLARNISSGCGSERRNAKWDIVAFSRSLFQN